jgi:hypothetical protein
MLREANLEGKQTGRRKIAQSVGIFRNQRAQVTWLTTTAPRFAQM